MCKIRLYRAISKREKQGIFSLDSEDKFDVQDGKLIADEIYSHTLSTYRLRKGIFYSFTDDIEIAYRYLNKDSEKYFAIGYVDVVVTKGGFSLPEKMTYLFRICEVCDWLRLAELKDDEYYKNLNYKTYPIPIINTLIPAQKSAWSWAKTSREYVAVCNGLKLQIIDKNYDEPEWCKPFKEKMESLQKTRKLYELLKNEVQSLEIKDIRKKFVLEQLELYYR